MTEVREALETLTTRVEATEVILAAVEARLGQLEQARVDAEERMIEMRLLLEDQEWRESREKEVDENRKVKDKGGKF